jgi:hypothetical protein
MLDAETLHFQQYLLEEEEDDAEEQLESLGLAAGLLILHGIEESHRLRTQHRQERRHYLCRSHLLPNPRANTPWQVLYASANDRAFITTMGFDVRGFRILLEAGFEEKWNSRAIPRPDVSASAEPLINRRSLDAAGALGLTLHYLSLTMQNTSLMQIFALIPTTVSRYLHFALKILLQTLRDMPDGRVQWLAGEEFQENNALITMRHPLLTGAFASMDGLNLPVQTSDDAEVENATYNGWLSEHFVSCVFVFAATGSSSTIYLDYIVILSFCLTGVIIGCNLNAPGSWHDSRVARPLYEKLRAQTPEGYYVITDTAFPKGTRAIEGRIKSPMKSETRLPLDKAEREYIMQFDRQLLSFRQTAVAFRGQVT